MLFFNLMLSRLKFEKFENLEDCEKMDELFTVENV